MARPESLDDSQRSSIDKKTAHAMAVGSDAAHSQVEIVKKEMAIRGRDTEHLQEFAEEGAERMEELSGLRFEINERGYNLSLDTIKALRAIIKKDH